MCDICNSNATTCSQPTNCSCPVKDLSTDCVQYTGDDLTHSGIKKGTILTEVLPQLDTFIYDSVSQLTTGHLSGTVVSETNSSTKVWNVIINGVARKILLA